MNLPLQDALIEAGLSMTSRTLNLLERNGIKSLSNFLELSLAQAEELPRAGQKTVDEIISGQEMLHAWIARTKKAEKKAEAAAVAKEPVPEVSPFQERIDYLRGGAREMRKDRDPRWHTIADWADLEASTLEGLEPFRQLMNVVLETKTGVRGFLRFAKTDKNEPMLATDTSDAAVEAVRAYLGDE